MKVLNLQCQHQHLFEGWFASEDDYQSQRSRDLVECPVCGDNTILKMLSAPRLNLLTSRLHATPIQAPEDAGEVPVAATPEAGLPATLESQAAWLHMVQHVIANTEDVGQGFAEEARKMHYGESQVRGIRGHASADETAALQDEGIEVMPFMLPQALKQTLQ